MKWTVWADVIKTIAAGVTAVIATFKFLQEFLNKPAPPISDTDEQDQEEPKDN